MIEQIFNTLKDVITGFFGALGEGVNSITGLIYNSTSGTLTTFGALLLIGAGVGIVYWLFRMIRGLIRAA